MILRCVQVGCCLIVSILWVVCAVEAAASEQQDSSTFLAFSFSEELLVRPLLDGNVLAHWHFVTVWNSSSQIDERGQHFGLFPKTLGQVALRFSVQELHLSLTQGRWDFTRWGAPVMTSPVGAELWAWLLPSTQRSVERQWKGLTHALSGLFCGSFSLIDGKSTCEPKWSFQASIAAQAQPALRYGALPREAACTENLTPWAKLLPCGLTSGLGSLINPEKISNSRYRSITAHVLVNSTAIELVQTLSVVLSPQKWNEGNIIRRDWDLESLLGSNVEATCPLSSNSTLLLDVSTVQGEEMQYTLDPDVSGLKDESNIISRSNITHYDVTALAATVPFKLKMNWIEKQKEREESLLPLDRLHVHQYATGYGQQEGTLVVDIWNGNNVPLNATYFQTIPFYIRVYFHTLSVAVNESHLANPINVVQRRSIKPAEDRGSPAVLELMLNLAANTMTRLSLHFEKEFLHYTEYPPDPHRGMHIPSAVITYSCPLASKPERHNMGKIENWVSRNPSCPQGRRYTETVVVNLPTPDFSMPYNVMTLTGAAMALFFASLFKLLTSPKKQLMPSSSSPPSPSLVTRFFNLFKKKKKD